MPWTPSPASSTWYPFCSRVHADQVGKGEIVVHDEDFFSGGPARRLIQIMRFLSVGRRDAVVTHIQLHTARLLKIIRRNAIIAPSRRKMGG